MEEKSNIGLECDITTGKLDSNAFVEGGKYPFFTCSKEPTTIDHYAYDDDVVLIAGNNAQGNFHVNRYKGKFNAYQRTYILKTKGRLSIEFLYYLLKIKLLKLKERSQGSQTKFLTIGLLKEIGVPEIRDSLKIGSTLRSIDAKIEVNNKINAELEAMAKLIYDYWFVQFDFPDASGQPYKSSGGKMVYNQELKREIPEGWGVKELSACIDKIIDHRGKTPKKMGADWSENHSDIIALSAKIVKSGKLYKLNEANRVSRELYDKWMPEKLIDGDILMTSEAPAGEFYFIYRNTEFCLSQRLFAIRSNKELLTSIYLYFELSKGHGYSQIMGSLSGSTVFGIRQDNLRKVNVVIPELKLQQKFEEQVLDYIGQIRINEEQNQKLSELRDWLLPMLMNGQVRVSAPQINAD